MLFRSLPPRTGNRHGGLAEAPYNVYPAKDGFIAIICNNNRHFHGLLAAMGREELKEDERFRDLKSRIKNIDAVDELVEAWTATLDRAAMVKVLLTHRVPHAPVRDLLEVMNDPNMHARGSLKRMTHPEFGDVIVPHSPIRFEDNPLVPLSPSARLGADNASVYRDWLGCSEQELAELARDKVI